MATCIHENFGQRHSKEFRRPFIKVPVKRVHMHTSSSQGHSIKMWPGLCFDSQSRIFIRAVIFCSVVYSRVAPVQYCYAVYISFESFCYQGNLIESVAPYSVTVFARCFRLVVRV